jgi:AcrR family transcriptional regulator
VSAHEWPTTRAARNAATRERILDTAERLFAEHGVFAVSNRQVGEAAGQGNTAAVGYHFGTKADLVRAIVRRRAAQVERIRERALAGAAGSTDLRDWVGALVRPHAEHLAELGTPSRYARFSAQVMTDPGLREIMIEEALGSPALQRILAGLHACLAELPDDVRRERGEISRQLIVHMLAERERALARSAGYPPTAWQATADGLVDAVVGVWQAPVSRVDPVGAG